MSASASAPEDGEEEGGFRHGEVVRLTNARGHSQKATIDARSYRGPALTLPGDDHIVYLHELQEETTIETTGRVREDYDHRITVRSGRWD